MKAKSLSAIFLLNLVIVSCVNRVDPARSEKCSCAQQDHPAETSIELMARERKAIERERERSMKIEAAKNARNAEDEFKKRNGIINPYKKEPPPFLLK